MIKSPPEFRNLTASLSDAVWSLAAIGTLFEAGLADLLAEPRTIDQLAAACPAHSAPRIAKLLALAATHGVVVADGARYRLAEGMQPVMCGPLRATMSGDIRSTLMQAHALLDAAKTGAPPSWRHTDPVLLQAQGDASSVMPAMIKMAPPLADLAARLARPGAKMLDVGAGVAALAIAACKAFPELHVVGLETFEAPLALARANIARAGVADRLELRETLIQDLRDEAAYAMVWLPAFFIAPDMLPAAIARAVAALEPGGTLVMAIGGFGDARQRAVWELVTDLWGGPTGTVEAAEAMLTAAGLREVKTLPGPAWGPQLVTGQR